MADTKNTTTRTVPTPAPVDGAPATNQHRKPLIVLAPLVATKDSSGRLQYLYRGTPMPEGTSQEELDRLIEMDMIGEDDGTAVPGVAASPQI